MKVSEVALSEIKYAVEEGEGLAINIHPFVVNVQSKIPVIASSIARLYADYSVERDNSFVDFHVRLHAPGGIRRWYHRQANFILDEKIPFKPLPYSQAYAMFEWGINWSVASHIHQYLIIHSAVVERNNQLAIIFGAPGAGKSTLCAGLVTRGWRLFSDEMALIALDGLRITPFPRPVSLKDASIDVIQAFAPDTVFGTTMFDTHKGTVSHMKPPQESVDRASETAMPAWIIAPTWRHGAALQLQEKPKTRMFLDVAQQTFNYHVLGKQGFNVLADLISLCDCYTLTYSDLDEAVACLNNL